MSVTYTVQADSECETRVELERLRTALGAEPLGRPVALLGAAPTRERTRFPRKLPKRVGITDALSYSLVAYQFD